MKNTVILTVVVIYYFYGFWQNIQGTFYITTVLFWVGLAWAENEDRIVERIGSHERISLYSGILYIVVGATCIVIRGAIVQNNLVGAFVTTFSDILICTGYLLSINHVAIDTPLTQLLGRYSYEIYVFQGISFIVFTKIIALNVYINCGLSFGLTCILSLIFHPLFTQVNKKCKALV